MPDVKAPLYLFAATFAILSLMNPVQAVNDGSGPVVSLQPRDLSVPSATGYLQEAHTLVAGRNWTGLLAVTDEAIAWYPDRADFRCINGYALRKLGRYQEAVDQISKAIVFDNKAVRFANRGYSYLALGNFRAALADADAGISREPAYPATYAVRAIALHGLGRDTEAVTAIDHALALEPGSAHYWHVKGRIFATPGTCMGAREALETSLALDPQYEQPWPGFASARTDLAILESTCPSSGSTGVS